MAPQTDYYKTIASETQAIYKVKGSKFIAFLFPVDDENAIKRHLAVLRKQHFNANHHVYAWRLGADAKQWRANDDGEPTNSSGLPVLGALQKHELTNILAVVIRYFGGTLLGVRGLMDAYKKACLEAVNTANIVNIPITYKLLLDFEYPLQNKVQQVLKTAAVVQVKPHFEASIKFEVWVLPSGYHALTNQLNQIYGLRATSISNI